jgi:hypothetical protein
MVIAGRTLERGGFERGTIQGGSMKIYLLMLLISAIAALSHLDGGRESPEREA